VVCVLNREKGIDGLRALHDVKEGGCLGNKATRGCNICNVGSDQGMEWLGVAGLSMFMWFHSFSGHCVSFQSRHETMTIVKTVMN
jgi:hypothetical protein